MPPSTARALTFGGTNAAALLACDSATLRSCCSCFSSAALRLHSKEHDGWPQATAAQRLGMEEVQVQRGRAAS